MNKQYKKSYFFKFQKKKKVIKGKLKYLYKNKKIQQGIFLKTPVFKNIVYPFKLNFKLVNEYIKKY